jgi:hypothetical protein
MTAPFSLLAGRNQVPLTLEDQRRATNTFTGMDDSVVVRYEASAHTGFRVAHDESGEYGEIVFGPDVYPGASIIDPNSALSLDAAVAHELTHYYRWRDKRELRADGMIHLDEALTSLEASVRYEIFLKPHDLRQLVSDAIQRIQLHVNQP